MQIASKVVYDSFVIAKPVRTPVVAISGCRFVRTWYFLHKIAASLRSSQ